MFLLAGLPGLFGEGVLSSAREDDEGFYIEYQRYLRDETPTDISIYIKENSGGTSVISISKDYIENVKVQNVVPQLQSVQAKGQRLVYTFSAASGGLITFNLMPLYIGTVELDISVQGKQKQLSQFVFF